MKKNYKQQVISNAADQQMYKYDTSLAQSKQTYVKLVADVSLRSSEPLQGRPGRRNLVLRDQIPRCFRDQEHEN